MSDRRKIVAETIRDYQTRRWVACEHTQLISFGGCADAVLAALDEHDAAEVERLRRAYNALTADRNRLAAQVRDLAAQGGRERDERDEARAEVERLRAELATVLKNYEHLQGTAIKLEGERDEARAEIAEAIEEGRRRAEYVRQIEAERDEAREQVQRVRDRHRPKAIQVADDVTGDTTDITVCQECDGLREQLADYTDPILHPCATIRALDGTEASRD